MTLLDHTHATAHLDALTDEDRTILGDVVGWADLIGMSFVRTANDVTELQQALAEHGCADRTIVIKIETVRAFENLPEILRQALRSLCSPGRTARPRCAPRSSPRARTITLPKSTRKRKPLSAPWRSVCARVVHCSSTMALAKASITTRSAQVAR